MTAPPAPVGPQRLRHAVVDRVAQLLETDFGRRSRPEGILANQQLLDALDRGLLDRFSVWPGHDPAGVVYVGASGTVAVCGLPASSAALAEAAEQAKWRVLIGAEALVSPLLAELPAGLFRRRPTARQQRFMIADGPVPLAALAGYRRATRADLDVLVDYACRLHVEDEMGPPIPRSARSAVRARMEQSIDRAATWVVERDGRVVAKVDVSLRSRRRGAQIAGVYVHPDHRGRGIAGAAVQVLTADLLADGLPGVTLHVRTGNLAGVAAYRRAGFIDRGPLTLALR